jgi:hypothetical protein
VGRGEHATIHGNNIRTVLRVLFIFVGLRFDSEGLSASDYF